MNKDIVLFVWLTSFLVLTIRAVFAGEVKEGDATCNLFFAVMGTGAFLTICAVIQWLVEHVIIV